MPKLPIFNVANMSFSAFRDKKILAKISEFQIMMRNVTFVSSL